MVSSRRALSYASALILPLLVAASAAAQQTPPSTPPSETPPAAGGPSNAAPPPGTVPQTTGAAGEEVVGGGSANPAPKRKAEEEITVTGTRVRRKDLSTPAPVTVISRQQVQNSAVASLGDFLQLMPEQGGATNFQVNNGNAGVTQISLRNLGANRTLVLVDGKRHVFGGPGADAAVDLNSIPSAAVERVEVLKDGASAVYGSDAIAGVVNIITRHRLNGTELSAYAGTSQHNDAQVYDINVVSGASGERGGFLFGAGYYDQHSFLSGNRDWAAHALNVDYSDQTQFPAGYHGDAVGDVTQLYGGSSRIPQGRVTINPSKCGTAAGGTNTPAQQKLCDDLTAAFGAKKRKFVYDPTASNAVDGFRPFTGADFYNYQAINYLVQPNQKISAFSNGEYKLADSARAYFQGSFVNSQSRNLLAPEPFDTGSLGIAVDANNAYNPFGITLRDVRKRLTSAGQRSSSFDFDTFRLVGGIDGTLPEAFGPAKGFFYDVAFNYGRNNGITQTTGSVNAIQAKAALGPSFVDSSGVLRCGAGGVVIAGCTPVNLFGTGIPSGDQLQALGFDQLVNRGYNQQTSVNANLSGELFNLASERPVGLAVGYEYRRELGNFAPDQVARQTFTGITGLTVFADSDYGASPTGGSYNVHEGYAELDVPLVSHLPLVEDLEVQAAFRAFKYNTFGSDSTYKLGARYRPVRDITLRATYSTAFRAPNVSELYSGRAPSAEFAQDPCGSTNGNATLQAQCGAAADNGDDNVQLNSSVGGNAKLRPETAKAFTAGVVLEPVSLVRNLTVTFDYWNIRIDNSIIAVGTENYLLACYPGANTAAGAPTTPNADACAHITRDPVTQAIIQVDDFTRNIGGLHTDGLDLAMQYAVPSDFGRFGLQFNGTYLLRYDQTIYQKIAGVGNYDLGLNPRVKFNAGLNYGIAGFSVGVLGKFIGSFRECPAGGDTSNGTNGCYNPTPDPNSTAANPPNLYHNVKPEMTFDVYASYLLRNPLGNTTLSAGVRNALNQNPVKIYNSALTYADPSAYDFIGRYFYARVNHSF